MGYRDYQKSRVTMWNTTNPLIMLIILNVMFFILLNFIKSIYTFSHLQDEAFYRNIYRWFQLSAEPMKILTRPWTVLTMPFTELKLLMLVSNLIWLWTFGFLVQDLIGDDKLFPAYLYSALVGGLGFVLTAQVGFPELVDSMYFNGPVCGIVGLSIVATTVSPRYRFFPMIGGGIPLWIITTLFVLLNVVAVSSNLLLFIPYICAGAMGFLYTRLLMSGYDTGFWMSELYRWTTNWFTPGKRKTTSIRSTRFYDEKGREPFSKRSNLNQQRIDMILDKINQKGYENLTEEEKKILQQASKEKF